MSKLLTWAIAVPLALSGTAICLVTYPIYRVGRLLVDCAFWVLDYCPDCEEIGHTRTFHWR